ncbi:MAG TPA: SDR family oxidoreductase [Dehalococcoidia bacterium]|nr:SDR family oxidoreductase [Dehalococcoidia bacterium]
MASGRWTLITGASSGIGLELARCFAADGDGLVLVARRKDRLETLAAELAHRHSVPVRVLATDLEDPAAPQSLKSVLDAEGITLHTLVNNAGFGLLGPFAKLSAERQLAMVQLNVVALTALSRLFLPGLIERRQGGILNLSSMAAFQAGPEMGVYYATKAYGLSLSEALHEEAKSYGVTVTALCPGPVATEFASVAGMERSRLFRFVTPMSAAVAARAGFEGYRAGKAIVIPGALNRALMGFSQLTPRVLRRRASRFMQAARFP